MRILQVLGVAALLVAPVVGQTVENYTVSFYLVGAAGPISTFSFPVSEVTCNLAPPAAGAPTVNPTDVIWDDAAVAGRVCRWRDTGTGPIFALPVGVAYEATLRGANSIGVGPESNRAGFSRLGPPVAAPGGLRFVRG